MTISAIINTITDEVTEYQLSRYIGTNEAFWKFFDFPIHERFPAVVQLDCHLENGQRLYFDKNNLVMKLENPKYV